MTSHGPTAPRANTEEKLRRVHAVTDVALARLDLDDLLTELLERTRDLLGADSAAIMLLDANGVDLVATAASGFTDTVTEGLRVPLGEGFVGHVAATGEPMAFDHIDADTVTSPILIDKHLTSMLGVPMLLGGRVIGVLHIGTTARRTFTTDDIDLLQLVADRASLATQARLAQLDRAATLALQRSLLPARPAAVAGFDVAARYIPGAAVGVGGDWYDLFTLPSGYTGVVIGDVAGNGLRAAVVMGRIRSALRAYAMESDDPGDVLARLDRKIQLFEPDAMATAVYGVIAPDRATMIVSVAGHLPPVLMVPDRQPVLLSAPVDLPLGAYRVAPRRATTVALPAGSAMLLYTDGLVEQRGRLVTDGIDLLLSVLGDPRAEDLCTAAIGHLLHGEAAVDDVAVLALNRHR